MQPRGVACGNLERNRETNRFDPVALQLHRTWTYKAVRFGQGVRRDHQITAAGPNNAAYDFMGVPVLGNLEQPDRTSAQAAFGLKKMVDSLMGL